MEIALRAHLTADATVAAKISTRLYPMVLPQGVTYPAATYQMIYAERDYTHDGPSGLVEARVQFDLYAKTYKEVDAIRKAFIAALNGWHGVAGSPPVTIQGVFWINEGEAPPVPELERAGTSVYRKTLEAKVWFQEN